MPCYVLCRVLGYAVQEGKTSWLLLGAAGGAMFGSAVRANLWLTAVPCCSKCCAVPRAVLCCAVQEGKRAWLLLGAAGGAMFGEATLGFYGSKKMVIKVRWLC
jgi:hypothetical protein